LLLRSILVALGREREQFEPLIDISFMAMPTSSLRPSPTLPAAR